MQEATMRKRLPDSAILLFVAMLGCTLSTERAQGPVPTRVTILGPDPLILDISAPYRVRAHVYDASGVLLDGRVRLAWSSSDTTIAVIDSSGALSMRQLGSTFIRAFVDTGSARAQDSVELDVIKGVVVQRSGPRPHP
jgi:hypothetical protein